MGTTPLSFFNFSAPQFDTQEAAGHAEVVVTRTGDLSTPATVDYSINGGSINGGSAFERADDTTVAGRLRFAPGESQKTFDILLTDDATQEQNETIELLIWKPTGAVMGIRDHATLVIQENDFGPASNPVDSSAFFDMTTNPVPTGTADLRPLDSSVIVVTVNGNPVDVLGTSVEQPPLQPNGGGLNSSLAIGALNVENQIEPGASMSVQFLLGIQQTGGYRFYVNIEMINDGLVAEGPVSLTSRNLKQLSQEQKQQKPPQRPRRGTR